MKKNNQKIKSPVQVKRDEQMDKLEICLSEGDFLGAKKAINDFVKADLTNEEKGKVYVNAVSTYLKMSNRINKIYLEHLDEAINSLKKLEVDERKIKEDLKRIAVKNKLHSYSIAGNGDTGITHKNTEEEEDF